MAEVQWDMARNGLRDFYGNLNTGMQMGQDLRMRQDQQAQRKAQAEKEAQAAAAEARKVQLRQRAAGGDETALLELYGVDTDTAIKLDDRTRKGAIDGIKYISNAAFQIATLPENQRAAAWDQYVDQGTAQFPGIAQYKGKYSPEALNSIVSQAGEMKEFQTFQQPKYAPVGENGLAGFQFGRPIQQNGQTQNFAPQPAPQGGGQGVVTAEQYRGAVNGLGVQGAAQWAKKNGIKVQIANESDYNQLDAGMEYIDPNGVSRVKGQ